MNTFLDCWIWAYKLLGLWIFAVNPMDSQILDHGSSANCRADSASCLSIFGSLILNEIWIVNLLSALVGMLMSSSKLFLFSKAHLNAAIELLLDNFVGNEQWHSHLLVYL